MLLFPPTAVGWLVLPTEGCLRLCYASPSSQPDRGYVSSQMQRLLLLLALGLTLVVAQPFQPGQNLAPLGMHVLLSVSVSCIDSTIAKVEHQLQKSTSEL